MEFKTTSKSGKLLAALSAGERLSESQIKSRFGLKNPSATVSDIRYGGFFVVSSKDEKTGELIYKIGSPDREHIAAGYRALSLGL